MNQRLLSIIIPVYNEEKTVSATIEAVLQAELPPGWEKEIVVINDGSTDASRTVLDSYRDDCTIFHCEENGGKGAALKYGLRYATGEYITIQDADLEYNPQDFARLLQPIIDGTAQVVFGSRVLGRNNVPYSQIYFYGGLFLAKVFNWCFKTNITDIATCYKIFPGHFASEIATLPSNDFTFDLAELTHFLATQHPIYELPISYVSRKSTEGKKMNYHHGIKGFKRIIKLYVKKPVYRFSEILSENN